MVIGVDTAGDIVLALFLDPERHARPARRCGRSSSSRCPTPSRRTPTTRSPSAASASPPARAPSSTSTRCPRARTCSARSATPRTGLVVIGKTPVLNADGTFTNASNTINTSQGGGPTTIGVNNQMFDPGDGAYFTFVKNPAANFLAGAPDGSTRRGRRRRQHPVHRRHARGRTAAS